jgi:hypothetical protein
LTTSSGEVKLNTNVIRYVKESCRGEIRFSYGFYVIYEEGEDDEDEEEERKARVAMRSVSGHFR